MIDVIDVYKLSQELPKGRMTMDEETTKTTAELSLNFSLRDMDEETIEILVEDMIATGG